MPEQHPKTAARRAALRALVEVETREKVLGAALDEAFAREAEAARPFGREIASGTLRHRARLDWTLAPLLKKPLTKLDAPVRAALRLAAYERLMLRTPAPVIGHEYAGLMRGERLASATAFVNAVTRKLPSTFRASPDAEKEPAAHLATEYSHPRWLVERWLARLGFDGCRALLEANNARAPLSLRVNTLRAGREAVLAALRERGLQARSGELAPDAIVVEDAGNPTEWPEWAAGLIIAQDEAAQLVSCLAAPQPGWTVIDAAAAPGGKTTHLAQLMRDEGDILACDGAAGRLKLIAENVARLGLSSVQLRAGDLRALAAELPAADIVLLDAPCLGTGTLRRRPDAKWRKTPAQLQELVGLQRELLDAAARCVRPGGFLLYSTCSLEREENEEQITRWLSENPSWRLEPPPQDAWNDKAQRIVSESGFLQSWPYRDGCDGMFAVKLRRE